MSLTMKQMTEWKEMQAGIEELREEIAKRDKRLKKVEGTVKRLLLGTACEHDERPLKVPPRPQCLDMEGFANNPKAQDQYDHLLDEDPQEGEAECPQT